MFDLKKYFARGLNNTLMLRNNTNLSSNGPWISVYNNTLLQRWHIGEFSSAELTISADFDAQNREIIKILICNGPSEASLTVYGRSNLGTKLIEPSVTVNDSYVDLLISPADPAYEGTKVIYTAHYFYNQNPLTLD